MLFGEPVNLAARKVMGQRLLNRFAEAVHAGGEELQHQRRAKAIDDQSAQAIAFRMYQAIGVGDGIESQPGAAQLDGLVDASLEKLRIDGLAWLAGQHT